MAVCAAVLNDGLSKMFAVEAERALAIRYALHVCRFTGEGAAEFITTVLKSLTALAAAEPSILEEIVGEGAIVALIETCEGQRSEDEAVVTAALKAISVLATSAEATPQILAEAPRIMRICASPAGESALQYVGSMICNIASAASPENLIEAGMMDALVKLCRTAGQSEVLVNASNAMALLCATSASKVGAAAPASVLLPALVDMLYQRGPVVVHAATCLRHLAHVEDFSARMLHQGAVEQLRGLLSSDPSDGGTGEDNLAVAAAAAALGSIGRAWIAGEHWDAKFDQVWVEVAEELTALCDGTLPLPIQANAALAIGALAVGAVGSSSTPLIPNRICEAVANMLCLCKVESGDTAQRLHMVNSSTIALGNISLLPTAQPHLLSIANVLLQMLAGEPASDISQVDGGSRADVAASAALSLANCCQDAQVRSLLVQEATFLPNLLLCCFCIMDHSAALRRDLMRLQCAGLHLLSVLAFEAEHGVLILTQPAAAPALLALCSSLCEHVAGAAAKERSQQERFVVWWSLRAATRCLPGLAATRDGSALLLKQESSSTGQQTVEVRGAGMAVVTLGVHE
jgi:hypothetical protein